MCLCDLLERLIYFFYQWLRNPLKWSFKDLILGGTAEVWNILSSVC